jgi:histidyl-tRNA synthetase
MTPRFQAPRGTFDVLPDGDAPRQQVERTARDLLSRAGYGRIETPIFEDTDLFERGVGQSTDIVEKEMFTFEDKAGRSVTLRPEGTAPICRAYLEHGMHKLAQPVKLWYLGPFFRHERPQSGRYREFNQLGAEAIGTDSPLADAELIMLLDDLLRGLGVPGVELRLGSLGSMESRRAYLDELKAYLRAHERELAQEVRQRIDINPLRAFDADDAATRAVMEGAPTMIERLQGEDAEHFESVRELLDAAGVGYSLDPTLVRGLDYYTRTIFSFDCNQLGAQSELGGGGRYDGLIEQLGGSPTPAVGWAAGIERILLALGAEGEPPAAAVFVAVADSDQRERAMAIVTELRRAGIAAELDLAGRSLRGQLRQADRLGVERTLILDADGSAQLRDMDSGEQREIDPARAAELLGEGQS